jgi:SAM-dependent methyltransferase
VATALNAQIDASLSKGYSIPGKAFRFDLRIRNISRRKWDASGDSPVRLSHHLLGADDKIIRFEGERVPLPYDLDPEQEITLSCLIPIPEEPGAYTLEFDMVQEFVAWFKDTGSTTSRVPIVVNDEVPEFLDYHRIWESAKLSKNYWSIVGPGSKKEFDLLGKAGLHYLVDLGVSRDSKILDVGCGTGSLTQAVSEFLGAGGLYCGTDLGKEAIEFCKSKFRRPNFRFFQNKMTSIPINGIQFDFIVFYSVFTHTFPEETKALLQEAGRLLAEGGTIVADIFLASGINEYSKGHAIVAVNERVFHALVRDAGLDATIISQSVWSFGDHTFRRVLHKFRRARENSE